VPRWALIAFLTAAARLVGGLLPDSAEDWGRAGHFVLTNEVANLALTVLLALGAVLPLVNNPQPSTPNFAP